MHDFDLLYGWEFLLETLYILADLNRPVWVNSYRDLLLITNKR
jgi:hypothetical protein